MKKILLSFLILWTFQSYGQLDIDRNIKHSVGYFGSTLINPGIIYSAEKTWKAFPEMDYLLITLDAAEFNLNTTAGMYWDPFSHVGFLNYYEINFRQYLGKRFAMQFGLGPGYQINFTGDNYVFDDDFNVKKRGLLARAYFAPEISSALILTNKKRTKQIISKVTMLVLVPYNNIFLPVFNYELHYQF